MSGIDQPATVGATAGRGDRTAIGPFDSAPGGGGGGAVDSAARSIYQMLSSYLRDLGLGDLATTDANGNPGGWLWQQIQTGIDSAEELRVAIESTSTWRDRFGVIVEQRQRAARGEPVQVMSVDEVVAYERSVAQLMRQAGLPNTFYDSYQDFNQLILSGMSVSEIDERLGQAFDRARNTAPEVRQAFEDFYGIGQGEGALAAFFLDPERTQATLDRASRAAYAAGMGERYGIGIDRARAEQIATGPMTEGGIVQGLEQVNRLGNVFREGLGETGTDLTAEGEGLDLVFDGSAEAQAAVDRRIGTRKSGDRSSTGGAALTNQGLVGSRRT